MPRVKGGYVTRQRRKRVLKLAKGYFGSKHTLYKTAHEQVMRSLAYSYRDRKVRKRDFRKLWIQRINAACQLNGMKYSRFINGLNRAGIEVNRKMLAEMAVNDAAGFAQLVELAKQGLVNEPVVKNTVEEVVAPVVAEEATDLESLKVADLRELAKNKGIAGYSTMKKAELIEALQ
jgi:large subunit ribosomal protein L20